MNIKSSILKKIEDSPWYSVFLLSDFSEYGSLETVRKVFKHACDIGLLTRASHGIYAKKRVKWFGEALPPLEYIAKKIAARDHATILPMGIVAANMLGLSDQVPSVPSYLTTGSTRKIHIGDRVIIFRHAAPRYFAFKGKFVPLLVQALKDIGEDELTEDDLSAVEDSIRRFRGDKNEFGDELRADIPLAPQWIQNIVKPMIKD